MAEGPAERVARLLAEGLEHFGQDRVERAIACWQNVLELDPAQQQARDYLESAGVSLAATTTARSTASRAPPSNSSASGAPGTRPTARSKHNSKAGFA